MTFLLAGQSTVIAPLLVLVACFVVAGFILRKIKQPFIIGYIMVGVLLGEHGFAIIDDIDSVNQFGELGIILLLFFIGMEIRLPDLVRGWKLAVGGTILQVGVSVLIACLIGMFVDWELSQSVVLGFVIALSSSAVIIKLLQDKGLLKTRLGQQVLSILLAQDVIIVPMLILTSMMGSGGGEGGGNVLLMLLGGAAIVGLLIFIYIKREIKIPFAKTINKDHELQVFIAIMLCFAGAMFASFFGLSPALGAFVGGMIVGTATCTDWIHGTLHAFRVLFVALFFVSIGLQINFDFIAANVGPISLMLLAVYLTNHLLNTLILKVFGTNWREAFLGGALLAQIGELSFLLSATAFTLGLKNQYTYDFTISLISLTLVLSPLWITLSEKILTVKLPKIRKVKRKENKGVLSS
jgi:CPA2 family monovalent cation:H+ antiporter-2